MAKELYDYRTHGDFKRYYDTKLKRAYWLLGYATNITIPELYELAKHFAEENKVDIETIRFDEILNSRWCKYFKVLYATTEHEKPNVDITEHNACWALLTS